MKRIAILLVLYLLVGAGASQAGGTTTPAAPSIKQWALPDSLFPQASKSALSCLNAILYNHVGNSYLTNEWNDLQRLIRESPSLGFIEHLNPDYESNRRILGALAPRDGRDAVFQIKLRYSNVEPLIIRAVSERVNALWAAAQEQRISPEDLASALHELHAFIGMDPAIGKRIQMLEQSAAWATRVKHAYDWAPARALAKDIANRFSDEMATILKNADADLRAEFPNGPAIPNRPSRQSIDPESGQEDVNISEALRLKQEGLYDSMNLINADRAAAGLPTIHKDVWLNPKN